MCLYYKIVLISRFKMNFNTFSVEFKMVNVWLNVKTVLTLATLHSMSILQPVNMGTGINTHCFPI